MSVVLNQVILRSLVHYDQESGVFTWLKRPETDKYAKAWNTRYAGKEIDSVNGHGYIQACITIDGVKGRYEVHRLAWLFVYGWLPDIDIDHENRIKRDNRIKNLRVADKSQTAHNVGLTTRNRSGAKGVNWHKASEKWIVRISICGEQHYLGTYDDLEEASAVYVAASMSHAREFSIFHEKAA